MISSKLLLVHQYFFLFHDIVCGEFFSLRFDVTTRVFLLESRRRRTEERERKNDCHLARVTCERVNERRGANNYSLRKFSLLLLLLLLLPSFLRLFWFLFVCINRHGCAHGHQLIRQEMAQQGKLLLRRANERLKHQNRRFA